MNATTIYPSQNNFSPNQPFWIEFMQLKEYYNFRRKFKLDMKDKNKQGIFNANDYYLIDKIWLKKWKEYVNYKIFHDFNINRDVEDYDYNNFIKLCFANYKPENKFFPLDNSSIYLNNGDINSLASFEIINKKCHEIFSKPREGMVYNINEKRVPLKFLSDKIILYINVNTEIICFRNGPINEEIIIFFFEGINKDKILKEIDKTNINYWLKAKNFDLNYQAELDVQEYGCKYKIINKNLKLAGFAQNCINPNKILGENALMRNTYKLPEVLKNQLQTQIQEIISQTYLMQKNNRANNKNIMQNQNFQNFGNQEQFINNNNNNNFNPNNNQQNFQFNNNGINNGINNNNWMNNQNCGNNNNCMGMIQQNNNNMFPNMNANNQNQYEQINMNQINQMNQMNQMNIQNEMNNHMNQIFLMNQMNMNNQMNNQMNSMNQANQMNSVNNNNMNIMNNINNQNNIMQNFPCLDLNNQNSSGNLNQNINFNPKSQIIRYNFYTKEITYPHKAGLENVGQSCYMNATIECLSNVKSLSNYLLENYGRYNIDNQPLCAAYSSLLYELFHTKESSIKPKLFKEIIGKLNPLFEGNKAADAKDLIFFIIETLHKELITTPKTSNFNEIDFLKQEENSRDEQKMLNDFLNEFRANTTKVSNIFYGINRSLMICNGCGITKYSFQTFNLIIFPLKKVKEYKIRKLCRYNDLQLNLYDAFECESQMEKLEGDNMIYCNNCRKLQSGINKNDIYGLPKILIIILNRGRNNNDFNEEFKFDEYLDFTDKKICINENSYKKYYLSGIITHFGESGSSGHFIAYCRNSVDNSFFLCYNDAFVSKVSILDSMVSKISERAEEKRTPYILLYHYLE